MSRAASAEVLPAPKANNIYTVLTAVALVVVILGVVCLWMRADTLFGGLLNVPPGR